MYNVFTVYHLTFHLPRLSRLHHGLPESFFSTSIVMKSFLKLGTATTLVLASMFCRVIYGKHEDQVNRARLISYFPPMMLDRWCI